VCLDAQSRNISAQEAKSRPCANQEQEIRTECLIHERETEVARKLVHAAEPKQAVHDSAAKTRLLTPELDRNEQKNFTPGRTGL
jgi:hypothetical protein